jgi:tRNA-binding protein
VTDTSTKEEIEIEDFAKIDVRLGRVVESAPLEGARVPAIRLIIDLGEALGRKQSSARITDAYEPADLVGRWVLAVVNLPPRRIAGFRSEVLTLGLNADGGAGPVVLVRPDDHPLLRAGDRLS